MDYTSATGNALVNGIRQYVDRDLTNGVAGTSLVAVDRNAVMNEIMKVITAAGLTPDAGDLTQLYQAIAKLIAAAATAASVGFTPVEQGDGPNQGTGATNAKINIGIDTADGGIGVRFSVGGTDYGFIVRSLPAATGDDFCTNLIYSKSLAGPQFISPSWSGRLIGLSDYSSAYNGATGVQMLAYRREPDGFISQSGTNIYQGTSGVATEVIYNPAFPIPFTKVVTGQSANIINATAGTSSSVALSNIGLTSMTVRIYPSYSATWRVEGY
ncbi:hypothetical protein [Acetobacter sp. DsW_063]|uniref:hypothetical protein n=1 Tax=Acetobacter sp. DsW_063 TaxID=1514894 RepID=UPI000A3BD505|nr:hypothetical protein [Acetobacter sp. DsW_063]OUJ14205.1 hypothetical protein HK28_00560 [Acetobacter sp. DsW_063]